MSNAKFSVYIAMSLDGFIARKDGSVDWLNIVQKENEDYGFQKFSDSVDAVLIGKNTYEVMKSFEPWPFLDKDCIVFANQPEKPIANEKFFTGSALDFYKEKKFHKYKHIYVDGGYLIHSFLKEKVISEMTISIIPILLGQGIPLFKGNLPETKLQLVKNTHFESGLVQVTYQMK